MKKLLPLILLTIILSTNTGCRNWIGGRVEIDKLIFTRVMGIDIGSTPDLYRVTISTKKQTSESKSGEGSAGNSLSNSLSSEGRTIFEAVNKLNLIADNKPFYGHTEFILVSERLARDGIVKVLDYVSRSQEFRFNAKVYITRGCTPEELISRATIEEQFIADRLRSIEDNASEVSNTTKVTLAEAMNFFDNPQASTYLPVVDCIEEVHLEQKGKNQQDIEVKDYAIFQGDKLYAFTTSTQSLGLNWLRNKVTNGTIIIKDDTGENITLEINNATVKYQPKIQGNDLSMDVIVKFSSNISELQGKENIFTDLHFEAIKHKQDEVVIQQVKDLLQLAQEANLDMFGASHAFFMKYPTRWEPYQEHWKEYFPRVKFNVMADSFISRTYMIREPVGSKEGKK